MSLLQKIRQEFRNPGLYGLAFYILVYSVLLWRLLPVILSAPPCIGACR